MSINPAAAPVSKVRDLVDVVPGQDVSPPASEAMEDRRQVELTELRAIITELEDVVMDMNAPSKATIEESLEQLRVALKMLIELDALDEDTREVFKRAIMGTISPLTESYDAPVGVPVEEAAPVKLTHVAERMVMLGFEYTPTAARAIDSRASVRVRQETGVEPMMEYRSIAGRSLRARIYSYEAVKILDEEIYNFFAQP